MKKLLALLLCCVMLFSVVACGGGDSDESSASQDVSSTETSEGASTDTSSTEESEDDVVANEQFDENGKYIPLNFEHMKIMKLTQWDVSAGGLFLIGNQPMRERTFQKQMEKVMKNIADAGYNTVLFQVRPFADSFYKSEFYPLSYFVSGSYANQDDLPYDVVEITIKEAHKQGLSIHGWFNPMRCMTNSQIEQIPGEWPIKTWFAEMGKGGEMTEYMFAGTDAGGTARLYLNPAYEEVRNLIINGVREICDNYKVDGIFMDDYFYPEEVKSNQKIDNLAYRARTDGSKSRAEFRRNSVNLLVAGIYATIKEADEKLIYGISPNGHIEHAYLNECADIYTWVSNKGYCDIMYPQFYYGMMHGQCSISALMKGWDEIMTEESIKLVPILTANKAAHYDQWAITEVGRHEWENYTDIILESLVYLLINEYRTIDGTGFFSYQYFWNNGSIGEFSAEQYDKLSIELENFAFIMHDYDELIGKDVEALKAYFTEQGKDLVAMAREWDSRLLANGFLDLFYTIK